MLFPVLGSVLSYIGIHKGFQQGTEKIMNKLESLSCE